MVSRSAGHQCPQKQCFQAISTELISWEEEYKDDPRYWQLRAFNNIDALPTLKYTDPDAAKKVIELIQDGCTDEGCFGAINYYYLNQNEPPKAIEIAALAIEAAPDNAFHHYMLAQVLADQVKLEEAVQELKAGNAALRNELPPVFPLSTIAERPEYFDEEAA